MPGSRPRSFLQSVHAQPLGMSLTERDQYGDRTDADLQSMGMAQGAPDPAVYENKNGGNVDTLEDLLEKATTQLDDARGAETAPNNELEVLNQSLTDEVRFAEEDSEESKRKLSETAETEATAEGDLAATSRDLAEDPKAPAASHGECQTKAAISMGEAMSRDEELGGLAKAKSILAERTAGATSQAYGFEQTSMFQLPTCPGSKAVSFVKSLPAFECGLDVTEALHRDGRPEMTLQRRNARSQWKCDLCYREALLRCYVCEAFACPVHTRRHRVLRRLVCLVCFQGQEEPAPSSETDSD